MADIRFPVNVALAGVPVNVVPLVDSSTGATIQGAVTYNQAGLALRYHFVTTAGAYTVASITPTTGGLYDWVDPGDSGIYTIEMPISGGTTNGMNTRTGFGWFTGVATSILPWRSPVYEFAPPNVVYSLTDGVEWLEATTLANKATTSGTTTTVFKQDDATTQYVFEGTYAGTADVLVGLAGKT
jgi:hypothetical protein